MMVNYKEMTCSLACNKLKRKIPFGWDLNIYRGCEHGCKYCYAMYSHQYLDSGEYFNDIYVKTNIVEQLEQQLRSPSWRAEVINIGGVTDSYQPIEEQYKLMPDILRLLIKYKTPCIISTKSNLILRDYDLIAELANITYVNIAATVICMDENIRRKIEPKGVESLKRFEMLKEFAKTNASTGLHFMPIIPYITDGRDNVDSLYAQAKDCKVDYVLPGTLYLRGKTRTVFFDFIKQEFPSFYGKLQVLYKTGGASKEYKDKLYLMVNELKAKYNLSGSYSKPMKEKMNQSENTQISIFECNGGITMVHLVYCDDKEKVLEKILEGSKTMIIRGAAGRKLPHSRVFEGERLYFMKKGTGLISARATVKAVKNYTKLSQEESLKTIHDHQSKLNLSEKQITRWNKKCLCLVEFHNVEEISPLEFDHQSNMDDWMIIDKIDDVVVGTSIPYNYEKTKLK